MTEFQGGTLHVGHCLDVLRTLDDDSIDCCMTSPPYYGLRDYGLAPVVWGGEPDCAHQWGEPGVRTKGGPPGAKGGK